MNDLGERLNVAVFAIKSYISEKELGQLLQEIIGFIGMSPYGEPIVKHFPTPEGLGGEGETLVQPFLLQPLTESFTFTVPGAVASDSYKNGKRSGDYVLIASCKPFKASDVYQFITKKGYNVVDSDAMSVSFYK